MAEVFHALGMMSGTSLDGVDLCLLRTDGEALVEVAGRHYRKYPDGLAARLGEVSRKDIALDDVLRLERDVTEEYAKAALESGLLGKAEVVGCHGQTVRHLPQEGLTWQLGNPSLLAERIAAAGRAVPVVMDFRRRDMAAGGEGAPLAPLFHAVMMRGRGLPAAMLNIGGVANVTMVAADGRVSASDCGPGMGLLDSWVRDKAGMEFDKDGALAAQGKADGALVARALAEVAFWQRPVPRSADRYEFYKVLDWMADAAPADGAATLAALTVAGIDRTLRELGADDVSLKALYATGGGSYHPAVMAGLKASGWAVEDSAVLGWEATAVEAACFAWLAARRLRGLPTSTPETTRCAHETVGGVLTV